MMSSVIVVALVVLSPTHLSAQTTTDSKIPTISIDVQVVNVLASVRDKSGQLVNNLTRDDFVVVEDGEPQEIRYFARQTDLPLTIGLLVDTSVSQERVIDPQKQAAAQFFEEILRHDKDLAFLISFDVDIELLQDLTNSRKLLNTSLQRLRVQGSRGGLYPGPVPQSRRPVGTALFDSVYLAAQEVLRAQVGRKAVVLISDGNDYGSRIKRKEAIEAAHRADVVVYGIRYLDREFYFRAGSSGGGGGATLKKIAKATGGNLFEVKEKMPLRAIFTQIQKELRNQYSIGYRSNHTPGPPAFRRIELRTKRKDLTVQARNGYYTTDLR
tara:strand:- start:4052 stop:5029 length:978 start_codon:yes stop_codon:yes gene_type:complete